MVGWNMWLTKLVLFEALYYDGIYQVPLLQ